MNDEIIEFLLKHGEKTIPEMPFPHIKRKSLTGRIARMAERGEVDRRMVSTPRGDMWAYVAIKGPSRMHQHRNESDPVYFLRNMPKKYMLQHCFDLLESGFEQWCLEQQEATQ